MNVAPNNGLVDSVLQVFDTQWQEAAFCSNRAPHGPMTARMAHQWRWIYHMVGERLWTEQTVGNNPSKIVQRLTAQVAEPLLGIVIRRLEEQHLTLRAWQKANREWDPESFHRSAIEPHEQNGRPRATDVLIDAARDCLEWLAANQAGTATRWCDQLVGSEVPLLRRLAMHTLSARTELAADQKIDWLLKHIGLHDFPAHHEIFRAVKLAYPRASPECRIALIKSVLAHRWPDEKAPDKERRTAYSHFNWLALAL